MGIFGGIPPSSSGSYYFPGASSGNMMGGGAQSLLGSAIDLGYSSPPMPTGAMSGPGYNTAFNTTNPNASTFAAQDKLAQAQSMQMAGGIMSVASIVNDVIGNYYSSKQAQYEAKSKASAMQFQADMANINASMSMEDAASIIQAGQQQKAQFTMRAGMEIAQEFTRQGARGIRVGAGSAAETQASRNLVMEIDAYTIDSNALRQSQARRMQAVNLRNQGLLAGTSAQTAYDMSTTGSTGATLLSGASRVAGQYLYYTAQQA